MAQSQSVTENNNKTEPLIIRTAYSTEQIIQNFYNKIVQIIIQSRVNIQHDTYNINRYFNIETNDYRHVQEELAIWSSFIKRHQLPPPLYINIYLETDNKRILIESWKLSNYSSEPNMNSIDLDKRVVLLFRVLHSLVRLLPSHNLHKRLKRNGNKNAFISYKLLVDQHMTRKDDIFLDKLLYKKEKIDSFDFQEILTPFGTLKLQVSYREHCPLDIKKELFHSKKSYSRSTSSNTATFHLTSSRSTASNSSSNSNSSSSSSSSNSSRPPSLRRRNISDRRISTPIMVSPFKSPSLSPQPDLLCSQTFEKMRSMVDHSRKIEFSSCFDRYKNTKKYLGGTRRGSQASDHSIRTVDDEEDLKEFMKFIGTKQELKIFHHSLVCDPKQDSLSYFRDIHNVLSSYPDMVSSPVPFQKVKQSLRLEDDPVRPICLRRRPSVMPATAKQTDDDDDSLLFRMSELGDDVPMQSI
ncbi:unnamed protein product [Rhizopus microsporus]